MNDATRAKNPFLGSHSTSKLGHGKTIFKSRLGVYSPVHYLQVLWQYSLSTDLGTPMWNSMVLMKNPQFWSNLTQTFRIWPLHGAVNSWKFELNWIKIVDFSLIVLKVEISHWGAQVCIVVILTSIEPILEKCVHLQALFCQICNKQKCWKHQH